jgi:hypothetical protein
VINAIYAINKDILQKIADIIDIQVEVAKVILLKLKKPPVAIIVTVEEVIEIEIEIEIGIEIEEMIEIVATADVIADLALAQAVNIEEGVMIEIETTIDAEILVDLPRNEVAIIDDIDKHIIL